MEQGNIENPLVPSCYPLRIQNESIRIFQFESFALSVMTEVAALWTRKSTWTRVNSLLNARVFYPSNPGWTATTISYTSSARCHRQTLFLVLKYAAVNKCSDIVLWGAVRATRCRNFAASTNPEWTEVLFAHCLEQSAAAFSTWYCSVLDCFIN